MIWGNVVQNHMQESASRYAIMSALERRLRIVPRMTSAGTHIGRVHLESMGTLTNRLPVLNVSMFDAVQHMLVSFTALQ